MYRFVILFLAFGCASKSSDTADSGLTPIAIDEDGGDGGSSDGGDDDDDDDGDDGDDDGGGTGGNDDGGTGDDDTGGGDDGGDDTGGDDGGGDDGGDPIDDCGDAYEPNDEADDAHDLGDIEGETVTLSNAYMATEDDEDRFMFYVEDGWLDWFDVSVRVTDIPDGVDLKVELIHVLTADGEAGEGLVAESEDTGSGGTEELSIGEGWWPGDQSGWYHVVVSSRGGSTCDGDYTLIIAADSGGLPDDDDDDEPVVEDCSGWTSDTDIHEPNDPVAKAFGDMDGEEFDVEGGYLYPDTDIDRYSFVATDGWIDGWDGVFDIQARLTEVPAGVNLKLELWHMETEDGEPGAGLLGEPAETGLGGTAEVSAGGFWDHLTDWSSGSGLYEVVVTSVDGTSSCNPYTLTISADTR